jgi:hypothetical protein
MFPPGPVPDWATGLVDLFARYGSKLERLLVAARHESLDAEALRELTAFGFVTPSGSDPLRRRLVSSGAGTPADELHAYLPAHDAGVVVGASVVASRARADLAQLEIDCSALVLGRSRVAPAETPALTRPVDAFAQTCDTVHRVYADATSAANAARALKARRVLVVGYF